MFDWEFRDPWFLLLLPCAALCYWVATRRSSLLGFSSIAVVETLPVTLRQRLSRLPEILMALAVLALVVALARPRTPEAETRVSRDGIAIMMVVDLSSSMNARDLVEDDTSVNRLDVVKEVFSGFVLGDSEASAKGRSDDLIGLVTFARFADSACPLTLDHTNLSATVQQLEIVNRRGEDGTAVGDGLGLAIERLRRSTAKSRVAILLTDGVNNAGVIQPGRAADLAAENDIKVYSIGAGTNGIAPYPTTDFFGNPTLVGQKVEIDEETLRQIAAKTGGKYFRAQDRSALQDIYSEIDALERTEVTETRYLSYIEHFPWWVGGGMLLFVLATLANASWLRRLP